MRAIEVVDGWALEDRGMDGRGSRKVVALGTVEEDIRAWATVYHYVSKTRVVVLEDGSLMEVQGEIYRNGGGSMRDELRKRALAKLTPEERAALGH